MLSLVALIFSEFLLFSSLPFSQQSTEADPTPCLLCLAGAHAKQKRNGTLCFCFCLKSLRRGNERRGKYVTQDIGKCSQKRWTEKPVAVT